MRNKMSVLALAASMLVSAVASAQGDSSAVAATISGFHGALEAGDSIKVLSFLADDVQILESGGVEDKQKFRGGHLAADIRFAQAVKSIRTLGKIVVNGSTAWVVSSSVAQGESNGRPVNSQGAELMVLSKERDGWKIRAIHWSSRTRRP
jgi:ketosteroid isomerase-like protein